MRSQQNPIYANFHEKALFVKGNVATPLRGPALRLVSFALCFHPHF
jgi:hypothetical protein